MVWKTTAARNLVALQCASRSLQRSLCLLEVFQDHAVRLMQEEGGLVVGFCGRTVADYQVQCCRRLCRGWSYLFCMSAVNSETMSWNSGFTFWCRGGGGERGGGQGYTVIQKTKTFGTDEGVGRGWDVGGSMAQVPRETLCRVRYTRVCLEGMCQMCDLRRAVLHGVHLAVTTFIKLLLSC